MLNRLGSTSSCNTLVPSYIPQSLLTMAAVQVHHLGNMGITKPTKLKQVSLVVFLSVDRVLRSHHEIRYAVRMRTVWVAFSSQQATLESAP